VGLLGLLLFLVVFSPWHAQYFQFWQGDVSRALSFLLLLLPVVGFLAFIWIHRPGTRTRA
jgi:hypothetical protein